MENATRYSFEWRRYIHDSIILKYIYKSIEFDSKSSIEYVSPLLLNWNALSILMQQTLNIMHSISSKSYIWAISTVRYLTKAITIYLYYLILHMHLLHIKIFDDKFKWISVWFSLDLLILSTSTLPFETSR